MTETPAEFVLDASVAVRGLLGQSLDAARVVDAVLAREASAYAPDLIFPEVTNAVRTSVGAARWGLEDAQGALSVFASWPLTIRPSSSIAPTALVVAVERGLSAYDAFYAALAGALEVPLVTADTRLAEAVPGSLLVV